MAVTPVLLEQIEKFHCLKVSTTQGLSAGNLRLHVATRLPHDSNIFTYRPVLLVQVSGT